jgi:RNA polymerase sigma factor (sigma-70 family)
MALLSDDRLAQRATKGDERAFAAIYRRYHQDLYRFCLAIVGNPADAQDALQNTMVKVLGALPGERRRIQLRPWLYRIAHNEAIELLRKRRDTVEVDPDLHTTGAELADTAATRERLRRLLADVRELPERQRAALVMRELAGLDFEQIGAVLETSGAAARQTVYEARLGLGQMEQGREMSCEHVMQELSDADGRVARRREIRAHLRACPDCRAFREAIGERRHGFAAIAPLPLATSAGLLHSLLGGAHAGAAAAGNGMGGGLAGTVAAGAGKTAATSAIVKSAATVAVVAVVGTTAADRSGMVDIGLPGGDAPIVRGADPGAEKGTAGQAPRPSTQQARKAGAARTPPGPGRLRT